MEGILRVKMLREKECRYKVQELNFLANTVCMLSRNKYKDDIRNAVRWEQWSFVFVIHPVVVNKPVAVYKQCSDCF